MPTEQLPPVGLGTMRYETSDDCVQSVQTALEMGYRHIDTAQKYENEAEVGQGIAESDVPRSDIFLATKVAEPNLAHDDVLDSVEESLDKLAVDQVDMLYVHWPAPKYDAEETLSAFNELLGQDAMRHVGLANFSPDLLDEAREILDVEPLAVQVEMHPLCQQPELHEYVQKHDMYLVAYCPLMRGEIFDVPELSEIADDAGISPSELSLAWLCSKDHVIPIPKATGEAHLRENFAASEIEVDQATLERVDAIDRTRRVVDPPTKAPWNW